MIRAEIEDKNREIRELRDQLRGLRPNSVDYQVIEKSIEDLKKDKENLNQHITTLYGMIFLLFFLFTFCQTRFKIPFFPLPSNFLRKVPKNQKQEK